MRRSASLRAAVSGQIRTAVFEGREHLVVPIIALVEGVIHAANSDAPELVLAEEFGRAPQGWNGRPAMADHPIMAGARVSANEPAVLEQRSFGHVFHAEVRGDKLLMEAYLDPAKAKKIGRDAERVIERVNAGEKVEVSVGVFVMNEEVPGVWKDGSRYAAIWREIIPDHLAMLPEGTVGACSVEMGCGAPRAAAAGQKEEQVTKTLKQRIAEAIAMFRPSQEAGQSDNDIRDSLWSALNAEEPAFLGVDSVFPDSNLVVYAVAPQGELQLYRREFSVGSDGAVSLASKKEEVKSVTTFEPVTAASSTTTAASCGCGKVAAAPTPAELEADMDKKDRVKAIIASGKTTFAAANAAALEALSDDALKALEDHVAELSKPPVAPPAPIAPPVVVAEAIDESKAKTPEELDAEFYARNPEVAAMLGQHKAASQARHASLVAELKAAQKAYSEDELKALPTATLEKLALLAKDIAPKPNFAGAGAPRAAATAETTAPAPIDLTAYIKDKQKTA